MKKILCILFSLLTVLSLVSCTAENGGERGLFKETSETASEPTTEDVIAKKLALARGNEEGVFSSELIPVPDEYFKEVEGGRPTVRLAYEYKGYKKGCVIYTPPGYDESKQYNIYYLLGGEKADEDAFFNKAGEGSVLQNMFDHMILNGEVEPFIAVNVNFFYHTDHHEDLDNGAIVDTIELFNDELRTAIIPAVESAYSTYAEGDTEIDYVSSRKHRCFGGFSLGSTVALLTLTQSLDYFYYFAPLCGADFATYYPDYIDNDIAQDLRDELYRLDYNTDEYFIFATEGENDNTFEDMNPVMERILTNDTDVFIRTDNDKSAGNITYKIMPGWEAQHKYLHAYRYYYNSLLAFWGTDLEANAAAAKEAATETISAATE